MKKYSLYFYLWICLGASVLIFFFIISLTISYQRTALIETVTKEKIRLAEVISSTIASPVWAYRLAGFPGLEGLEKTFVSEMAKFKDVVFLRIVRIDGVVWQSSIEEDWGGIVEDPAISEAVALKKTIIKDEFYKGETIKEIVYPSFEDRTIIIGFSLKSVQEEIKTMIVREGLLGLLGLILVYAILFLTFRAIARPINGLIAVCQRIGQGQLDVKVEASSKTEIGELAETFNKMINDLKESRSALEEAKTVLEIKVQARTRELKDLTETLEEEVKKRTKEVYEKMAEMEKFQKLAIGRELKMVELKEKIEGLKEQLVKGRK